MQNKTPVIGLTGGIGSGKSTVARMLADLGCVVADSDQLARQALEQPTIRQTLQQWWGDDILRDDGSIDRSAIARIVFNNERERKRLEQLTHPWIEQRRRELFAAAPSDARALVIDAPLLLEAGLDAECDAVIFVDAPRPLRLQRVQNSRGWDEATLAAREESQMPLDLKRQRADYVVQNDGDLAVLVRRVEEILDQIVQNSRPREVDKT